MTEAEWLTCTEPERILGFLRGRISDRKRRLFAAACCRRICHLLADERSRQAVEVGERYADAQATEEELETAWDAASAVWHSEWELTSTPGDKSNELDDPFPDSASLAAYNVAIPSLGWWGGAPAFDAPDKIAREISADSGTEGAAQCVLLRDMFGNPFRPVVVDPSWLTWNNGTVAKLAQSIYDQRAFDRLPVLADALEEAGCANADILAHCRQPGEHVRGCWVVDLLLGKE
jgi:hypothetical protein